MICNTDHEILRNTERIAIIWLKFHWFLVITIKWTIKILEFQINSLIIFDKNNMEKHWIREEENDPFHSPERCFFSQTPFLKTIKEPLTTTQLHIDFPKGKKSRYTTEKLLADIPRAPAPKKYSNETISTGRSNPPEQNISRSMVTKDNGMTSVLTVRVDCQSRKGPLESIHSM